MHDLLVHLENKPGTMAQLGEILGNAGINVEGVCGVGGADGAAGEVHILVQSGQLAREALADAGIACGDDRDVEVIAVIDQPGEMGRHLRRAADAGVNVDLIYMATSNRLVLGSSDIEALRTALHSA